MRDHWTALTWLNYNRASDVKNSQRLARKEVSEAKERHLFSSFRACQRRLWKSNKFWNTPLRRQMIQCPPLHCQHQSALLSLRVPPEVQALQRGRDPNDDHDSDAIQDMAIEVSLSAKNPYFHHGLIIIAGVLL